MVVIVMENEDFDRKRSAAEFVGSQTGTVYQRKRLKPDSEGATSPQAQLGTGSEEGEAPSWTLPMHRDFVLAIFKLGMNRASPNVITQNMTHHPVDLTAERIKSHLQKFRKNKDKSVQEFMEEYDALLSQKIAAAQLGRPLPDNTTALGAEIAANLTFASLEESSTHSMSHQAQFPLMLQPSQRLDRSQRNLQGVPFIEVSSSQVYLPHPNLSQEELGTPIGRGLQHVMGLIEALTDQLNAVRRTNEISLPARAVSRAMYSQPTREENTAGNNNERDSAVQQLWRELSPSFGSDKAEEESVEDDLNSLFFASNS